MLTRGALPEPGPDPPRPPTGGDQRNPEKVEGARRLAHPDPQARPSNRISWRRGGEGRREGAVSAGTAAWPCLRATDRPPQLLLSSPAGDQRLTRQLCPSHPDRQFQVPSWAEEQGGGDFHVAVIVRGGREETGGPRGVTQICGHTHFRASKSTYLSHVERPPPLPPCFLQTLALGVGRV